MAGFGLTKQEVCGTVSGRWAEVRFFRNVRGFKQ